MEQQRGQKDMDSVDVKLILIILNSKIIFIKSNINSLELLDNFLKLE